MKLKNKINITIKIKNNIIYYYLYIIKFIMIQNRFNK